MTTALMELEPSVCLRFNFHRMTDYRSLKVIRFGKHWAVTIGEVFAAAFQSRDIARAYRKALHLGYVDALYVLQFFRVDLVVERVQ